MTGLLMTSITVTIKIKPAGNTKKIYKLFPTFTVKVVVDPSSTAASIV